jgi:hypothetical protein
MAEANLDKTVYVPVTELLPTVAELYGNVGVVIYTKTFMVHGVNIWMVPEGVKE